MIHEHRQSGPVSFQAVEYFALWWPQLRLRQFLITTLPHVVHVLTHALVGLGIGDGIVSDGQSLVIEVVQGSDGFDP